MRIRRWLITATACALGGAATGYAADKAYEVTPEMAKEAVSYLMQKYHGDEIAKAPKVQVSEPSTLYSYDKTREYYVYYIYLGAGKVPDWETLSRAPLDYIENKRGSDFVTFYIPADKREFVHKTGRRGIPPHLYHRVWLESSLEKRFGVNGFRFRKCFMANGEDYLFVYEINGKETILTLEGREVTEEEFNKYWFPDKVNPLWDEIEGTDGECSFTLRTPE